MIVCGNYTVIVFRMYYCFVLMVFFPSNSRVLVLNLVIRYIGRGKLVFTFILIPTYLTLLMNGEIVDAQHIRFEFINLEVQLFC